ncbi:hypothetical protein ASE71_33630 [Ensifer sp. Root954]|jgi:hypothetical protein|nr:hypothetical protein ASD49_08585 [Ensifer sp. Root1298]KQX76939.1 hypothetical protein ASD41_08840 [Ensifer sp. Root1312]KRD60229.1 hypothetical protein ASE71_33630 [Ensifer sp. Root954]
MQQSLQKSVTQAARYYNDAERKQGRAARVFVWCRTAVAPSARQSSAKQSPVPIDRTPRSGRRSKLRFDRSLARSRKKAMPRLAEIVAADKARDPLQMPIR